MGAYGIWLRTSRCKEVSVDRAYATRSIPSGALLPILAHVFNPQSSPTASSRSAATVAPCASSAEAAVALTSPR